VVGEGSAGARRSEHRGGPRRRRRRAVAAPRPAHAGSGPPPGPARHARSPAADTSRPGHEREDGSLSAYDSEGTRRVPASQLVADFLAAFALFAGLVSLVYYPGRLGTAAVLIALFAAALGGRDRYLVPVTVGVTTACWFAGMILAVTLDRPIF
jgi:hypothetical protein